MCGLVGIAGSLRFQDEFTMQRLLMADYFRGQDSTGLAAIRANGDALISKINSSPPDLFHMTHFKTALNGNQSRAFIGHNRAATRGQVVTANAHPFQFGHIIGAHNGTLDKKSVERLQKELDEEFDVDSMALFAAIEKLGIDKTIKLCNEGKSGIDGAWALVWFDQEQGTLNFLRNKHRSLYYAYEKDFKRMFWASEWWMIREAVASSPQKYELYQKPGTTTAFFPFEENTHYRFDLAQLALVEDKKKKPKPKVKKLAGITEVETSVVPFVPSTDLESHYMSWPRDTDSEIHGTHIGKCGSPKSTGNYSTTKSHGRSKKRTVIQLIGAPNKPYANIIDEDKYMSFADNHGEIRCQWCRNIVRYGEPGATIFEREAQILCRKCSDVPDDSENPAVKIYVRGNIIDALS